MEEKRGGKERRREGRVKEWHTARRASTLGSTHTMSNCCSSFLFTTSLRIGLTVRKERRPGNVMHFIKVIHVDISPEHLPPWDQSMILQACSQGGGTCLVSPASVWSLGPSAAGGSVLPPTHAALSAQGQSVVAKWALMRSHQVRISFFPKKLFSCFLSYHPLFSLYMQAILARFMAMYFALVPPVTTCSWRKSFRVWFRSEKVMQFLQVNLKWIIWEDYTSLMAWQPSLKMSTNPGRYRIAGNFWGRKLLLILRFCDYSWKFSLRNLGAWHYLAAPAGNLQNFFSRKSYFHQFAKVFSCESFSQHGSSLTQVGTCSSLTQVGTCSSLTQVGTCSSLTQLGSSQTNKNTVAWENFTVKIISRSRPTAKF